MDTDISILLEELAESRKRVADMEEALDEAQTQNQTLVEQINSIHDMLERYSQDKTRAQMNSFVASALSGSYFDPPAIHDTIASNAIAIAKETIKQLDEQELMNENSPATIRHRILSASKHSIEIEGRTFRGNVTGGTEGSAPSVPTSGSDSE